MTADILAALARANLAVAAAILAVLLLRAPIRHVFGAGLAYRLWLIPPLAVAASLLPASAAVGLAPSVLLGVAAAELGRAASVDDRASWLMLLWGVGAIVWALMLLAAQRRFTRGLGELKRVGPGAVFEGGHPGAGPAVVGGLIVVPSDFSSRFSEEEREAVLRHEACHLQRGDVAANGVGAVAQCLCWFNPLVHLAVHLLRIDQELACDAAVVAAKPDLRRAYAEALLKTQIVVWAPPVGCTWPSRAQHPLKERIVMLKSPPPTRLRRRLGAGLIAALSLAGGYAAWAQEAPPRLIADPEWVAKPSGEDVARVYPRTALAQKLSGSAVMECRIKSGGELSACRVDRQSPEAAGFGEATLQLARLFKAAPTSHSGQPTGGGLIRIPVLFRAP